MRIDFVFDGKGNKMMYRSIYCSSLPAIVEKLADTPAMKRLTDISMHCGCDRADFATYHHIRGPYSRYLHSLGVAGIVWNFTGDLTQAAAGLLHDVATPVFAHTIDFMNRDYMNQESTEEKTRAVIENSKEIMEILYQYDIDISEVADYHRYPVADNDTPMLSADRLEYTLGNAYLVYRRELTEIQEIYRDLFVAENEDKAPELCFRTLEAAKRFTKISLKNSFWFVSDEERFAMQYLADMMKTAIRSGDILPEDLMKTETEVIRKLEQGRSVSGLWRTYTRLRAVEACRQKREDRYCVRIFAKKRYINPLVLIKDTPVRISEADRDIKRGIEEFLEFSYDSWLSAKENGTVVTR